MTIQQDAEKIVKNVDKLKNRPLFLKAEGAEVILADMAILLSNIAFKVETLEKIASTKGEL